VEVDAFQRLSNVVIQKSWREGFGLVVSEALWKGTPVGAGRAGVLGQTGQERAKQPFLIPRLVLNELNLLHGLEGAGRRRRQRSGLPAGILSVAWL
jgi:trehalose synthase